MLFYVCLFLVALSSVYGGVRRQSSLGCDQICDEEVHQPSMCGSDGVNYRTGCEFGNAACLSYHAGDVLHLVNYGPCITLNSSCDDVLTAHCVRSQNLDETLAVCGSDNVTYPTVCDFRLNQCHREQAIQLGASQISFVSMGKCPIDTTNLIAVDCSQYFTSQVIAVESGTIAPHANCDKVAAPVCTTTTNNGRTYNQTFGNECTFCQYKMSRNEISNTNMVAYLTHRTACPHTGLIG